MLARSCRLIAALLAVSACGDDSSGPTGPTEEGPVYVMMTQVYTADDRTVYFSLSDSLDVDAVSLEDAHEAPSVANFAAIGGKLYISSGEEPKITQYDVTADHQLEERGQISFAAFPFSDNANFYYHYIVDENLAYLPYDVTKRIAWSPSELAILSDETTSSMQLMDGPLLLEGGGNRTAVRYPEGPIVQPFLFHDENWTEYGTSSRIATYDGTTHDEARVQTATCPGLGITTRDETGRTYVSSDSYSPVRALYGDGPAPCVVRLSASGDLDAAWTTDLRALTGGRYTMNFRYLADGKAIANVLDADTLTADFTGPYDPSVEEQLWEAGKFRLWLFDLEANTARPIDGIDLPIGSGGQTEVIDGRVFLFAPFNMYGNTRVYELDLATATVATKVDVTGDVFKWERLR